MPTLLRRRRAFAILAATAGTLTLAGPAFAHAIVSPPVAETKVLQQFTLSVPTEKEGATTTKIVLTVPDGFAVDSYEPEPGWTRTVKATGSGENAVVNTITWSGGKVPTEEDSVFHVNASTPRREDARVHGAPVLLRRQHRRLGRTRELRHAGAERARSLRPRRWRLDRHARRSWRSCSRRRPCSSASERFSPGAVPSHDPPRARRPDRLGARGSRPRAARGRRRARGAAPHEPVRERRHERVAATGRPHLLRVDRAALFDHLGDRREREAGDERVARTQPGAPQTLVERLQKLPPGWYLVIWRVISADGHPVRGAFTFAVGPTPGPAPQFVIPSLSETAATPGLVGLRFVALPVRDAGGRAVRVPHADRTAAARVSCRARACARSRSRSARVSPSRSSPCPSTCSRRRRSSRCARRWTSAR